MLTKHKQEQSEQSKQGQKENKLAKQEVRY